MSVSISGILLDPYGQPARFAEVKFITWQGANDVLTTSNSVFKTSEDGAYSFSVEFGVFTVQVRYNQSNGKFQTIKQKVIVNSTTVASTLGELLLFNEPLTPPEIAYVEQLVAEAEGYRDESAVSAAESEASAQNSATSAAESAQSAIDAANSAALIAPIPLNGGVWASGQTYDFYNQYMIYNGEAYSPLPATVLPYTVGAVPDLGFVYQIKLNDHSLLANLNAVGAHNSESIDTSGYKIIYTEQLGLGMDSATTADNTVAFRAIIDSLEDGTTIDFCGHMYRVYAGVAGIPTASATPATDNAVSPSEVLLIDGKKRINFKNGGLYAANQSQSGVKYYYPSTLSFINCEDINFEQGAVFESKGESWGDSDASFPTGVDRRLEFLATNGGHALYFGRCDGITGSPTCRFSGSVGPMYFSSCRGIALVNPFSNSASIGYAPYSFDAWVGSLDYLGWPDFHGVIANPIAHAETLFRREDGVSAGSNVYCGKGGVITEDVGVWINSTAGYIADQWANGANKRLGYAFGAGVHSVNTNVGAIVRNCQSVAYANSSADGISTCVVTGVDAVVGLTGIMFGNQPFGTLKVTLKGKVRVNNSRVWPGEVETLSNTSLVASMKPASNAVAVIDCDAAADENPPAGSQGLIFSLISNMAEATYGGVVIEGGNYITNGYLIRSQGWGGGSSGNRRGLVISGKAQITDMSTAATDAYINYRNKSQATDTFTYIYHDLEMADIKVQGFRSLSAGYVIEGVASGLLEKILFPRKLGDTVYSSSAYRPRETLRVEFTAVVGLSGPDSKMSFVMSDGRIPVGTNCFITSDMGLHKVVFIYTPTVAGPLRCDLLLEGDVRAQFTPLLSYTILGG